MLLAGRRHGKACAVDKRGIEMKSVIKNAKAKRYMNDEAFNELELSLNQALTYARSEQGITRKIRSLRRLHLSRDRARTLSDYVSG